MGQFYEEQAVILLAQTVGYILESFPGISPLLAARYLAAIGDLNRFFSTVTSKSGPTRDSTLLRVHQATLTAY